MLVPTGVKAVSYHSYGVSSEEKVLMEEEKEEKRNFFEDIEYRFLEKDTHDAVDYVYLAIIIILMVVVITLLNKKTYIYPTSQSVFIENTSQEEDITEDEDLEENEKEAKD